MGRIKWLEREDSNLRMPAPKTGALPLGYAPTRIFFKNYSATASAVL